jgi:cephalosporin hydroxylase
MYYQLKSTPSDINGHLEILARLASLSDHVTEFGSRNGVSTVGLLFGRPRVLRAYDINPLGNSAQVHAAAIEAGVDFSFQQADTLTLSIENEPTDFLFIDTLHTYDQLAAELALHAPHARCYIAMHDTTTFGDRGGGEAGDPVAASKRGLWPAIAEFLKNESAWRLQFHFTHNNGLTVLERR